MLSLSLAAKFVLLKHTYICGWRKLFYLDIGQFSLILHLNSSNISFVKKFHSSFEGLNLFEILLSIVLIEYIWSLSKEMKSSKNSFYLQLHSFYWSSKYLNRFISVRHFWTQNSFILQWQHNFYLYQAARNTSRSRYMNLLMLNKYKSFFFDVSAVFFVLSYFMNYVMSFD